MHLSFMSCHVVHLVMCSYSEQLIDYKSNLAHVDTLINNKSKISSSRVAICTTHYDILQILIMLCATCI